MSDRLGCLGVASRASLDQCDCAVGGHPAGPRHFVRRRLATTFLRGTGLRRAQCLGAAGADGADLPVPHCHARAVHVRPERRDAVAYERDLGSDWIGLSGRRVLDGIRRRTRCERGQLRTVAFRGVRQVGTAPGRRDRRIGQLYLG